MIMTLEPIMVMMVQHRRKIVMKNVRRFLDPLPLINVSNICSSTAGAARTKKSGKKCFSIFGDPASSA